MLTFAQWFPRAAIAAIPFVLLIGCESTSKEEPASYDRGSAGPREAIDFIKRDGRRWRPL